MRFLILGLTTGCVSSTTWLVVSEDVTIALQERDDVLHAYICGNTELTRPTVTHWMAGTSADGVRLLDDGDWRLELDDDQVLSLEAPGFSFEAQAELLPAAIYDNVGTCRDGAIVHDGRVWGNACDDARVRFQVDPVDTLRGTPPTILLDTPRGQATFERVDL